MTFLLLFFQFVAAQNLKIELGSGQVQKNEFHIPNDSSGTATSMADSTSFYYRVEGRYNWDEKNGLRFVIAPFSYQQNFTPNTNINFDKQSFVQGVPTEFSYKFNSYRLGYVREWKLYDYWSLDLGITLKMRDALISLAQNGREEKFTDFGFVPLFYVGTRYDWNEQWSVNFNCDGAGSSQGYAVDALIEGQYHWDKTSSLALGLRYLDGGADNEKVKTFTTVQYFHLGYYYRFN